MEEFARCAVKADGHVLAGYVAGAFDGLDDYVEGVLGAVEVGGKAALVAYSGAEVALFQYALEVVEYLGAHADALAERSGADGTNHELLEADGSVGVGAAVDDVHHGHGQSVGVAAADVLVQGQVEVVGCGLCHGERYAEDGVGAEVALGVGAVELEHFLVDGNLVQSAHAAESLGDGAVDIGRCLEHALAHVAALVAVAELEGLVDAGRCARGNGSTAACAGLEDYVDFNGGVAARVKDFATNDFFDFHDCNIIKYVSLFRITPQRYKKIRVRGNKYLRARARRGGGR